MPHALAARAGELAHYVVHVAELFRALVVQHGYELLHHPRDDLGVVKRAVVVELRQAEVLADYVQLVPPQLRQQSLSQYQGVDHHGVEPYAAALAGGGHEAGVEGRVVRDYRPASGEVQKRAHGLRLVGGVRHVAVLYARQLRDVRRDVHVRVHEGAEGVYHPPAGEQHRAYLRQPIRGGGETCGLHVEGDELPGQRGVAVAAHGRAGVHVVYIIPLEAVDYLYAVLIAGLAHLRVGLRGAVVGDGDRLHAPGGGALDHLCGVGQGVEGGVARVQMQLHALVALGGVGADVHAGRDDGHGVYYHVAVELVKVHLAAHYNAHSGLDLAGDGGVLAARNELVDVHRAGVVGHVKAEYIGAALLYLAVVDGEDDALDRDVSALERDGGHVHGHVRLAQGAAVEQLAVLCPLALGLLLRLELGALGVERDLEQA